jgi:hypothetical protein
VDFGVSDESEVIVLRVIVGGQDLETISEELFVYIYERLTRSPLEWLRKQRPRQAHFGTIFSVA